MNFCSSHIYVYTSSENESISDDELSNVSNGSLEQSCASNIHYVPESLTSKSCGSQCSCNLTFTSNDETSECNCSDCKKSSCLLSPIPKDSIESENLFYCSSDTNNNTNVSFSRDIKTKPKLMINVDSSSIVYSTDEENESTNRLRNLHLGASNISNNHLHQYYHHHHHHNHHHHSHNHNHSHEKLYKQSSLSCTNSVVNYASHSSSHKSSSSKRSRHVKVRKPDTNIFGIQVHSLVTSSTDAFAGDPVFCKNCGAIFSKESKLIEALNSQGKKIWSCEYCDTKNLVDIDENEIPKNSDVTYLLEPSKSQDDDSIIVFCIDISGSMNVTQKLSGNIQLKSIKKKIKRLEDETGEKFNESIQETHVSRLDSLQFAVERNLEKLQLQYPNRRVVLIAFSDEVIILGDGTICPIKITKEYLNDENEILRHSQMIKTIRPIKDTKYKLEEQLYSLEANGSTALGPALFLSIHIASKSNASQVILCTDGLANQGFGNLEEDFNNAIHFYDNLTNLACEMGVSVSIITLKGTGCKLSVIGKLPERTNGYINSVDQADIKDEIETILEKNKILASNVTATIIAHKAIYIKDNNELTQVDDGHKKSSKLVKHIGNVGNDCELTFQYGINCSNENLQELSKIDKVPFQLQIEYKAKDGSKAIRVITQTKPHTRERNIAEKDPSMNLIAKHALSSQAKIVTENIFSGKTFSSVPVRSKLKSVSKYLHQHKYKNNLLDESFNSLLKVTNSKAHSSKKKHNCKHKQQQQPTNNSDEESELVIRMSTIHSSHF